MSGINALMVLNKNSVIGSGVAAAEVMFLIGLTGMLLVSEGYISTRSFTGLKSEPG
jgi:hypothetical protein